MTEALTAVRDLIDRLKDEGVTAICCGGAARDAYLGRTPKDYDLVIVDCEGNLDFERLLRNVTGSYVYDLSDRGGASEGSTDSTGDAEERGLVQVWETNKLTGLDVKVQFLLFDEDSMDRWEGDPYCVVAEHDCTLNQAFFEREGDRLVARVTDNFPRPGGTNFFIGRHVNYARKAYIRSKFPEYHHQF